MLRDIVHHNFAYRLYRLQKTKYILPSCLQPQLDAAKEVTHHKTALTSFLPLRVVFCA
jgi:hypothetical protein